MSDAQLLEIFICQHDEAAFAALVRRHGPMVFGVCRRVVGNHHDAEDALQATFLVLARMAASVRPRGKVANWLHGVALRTALRARAMTAKRRQREKQVMELPEPVADPQDRWRDVKPLLDQELNGLPVSYRLPILLCDLECKTIKEATRQLGWPQGTVAGRLARGRKLLAKRLARRGVVLSGSSLAVGLSQQAASASVPVSLMSATVKAAAVIAAGQEAAAGVVPAKVAALMEGVLKTMLVTKLTGLMPVTMALLAIMASVGVGLIGYGTATGQHKEDNKAEVLAPQQLKKDQGHGTVGPKEADPTGREIIAEVAVVGNRAVSTDRTMREIHTRAGLTYSAERVQDDASRLAATRLFKNVSVRAQMTNDGRVVVIYQVQEHPNTVREVIFKHAKHLSNDELLSMTRIRKGMPLDVTLNRLAVLEIQDALRKKGRLLASVTLEEGFDESHTRVVFNITEGPITRVRSTCFTGNEFATSVQLRTRLDRSRTLGDFGPYIPKMADEDVLQEFYRKNGYRNVRIIREVAFSDDFQYADITYHIQEGTRYRVNSTTIDGAQSLPVEQLKTIPQIK